MLDSIGYQISGLTINRSTWDLHRIILKTYHYIGIFIVYLISQIDLAMFPAPWHLVRYRHVIIHKSQ